MLWLTDIQTHHRTQAESKGLIDCLQHIFGTFGNPDEYVTDGGPEFTASAMSIPQELRSTPPPVICSPSTLKLQSRNWCQNCQMTNHQQYRPTWKSKHQCPTTSRTPKLEHLLSCHKAVTCPVCIWQTYQGLHTHTSWLLHIPPQDLE